MSKIYCKLVFRGFDKWQLQNFIRLSVNHTFKSLSDLDISEGTSYDDEDNVTDKRQENEFSFVISKSKDGGDERFRKFTEAFCELSNVFEDIQKRLRSHGLTDSATACMLILSKNIYPKYFALQNNFNVSKIIFGSIVNRRYLARAFAFDEPKDGHQLFDSYLDEHRDFRDSHKNMMACFEHDHDCITICFPDIIKGKTRAIDPKGGTLSKERVVDIRVPYSSIRRLIVSMKNELNMSGVSQLKVTFTFQISNPPFIYISNLNKDTSETKKLKFASPVRYLTWNPGFDIDKSTKYSNAVVVECCDIEPRTLFDCLDRLRKSITNVIEFRFLHYKKTMNFSNYNKHAEIFMNKPDDIDERYRKLVTEQIKYFPLVYAIQAIISRGGEVYAYLFRPDFDQFKAFLDLCITKFEQNLVKNPKAKITKTVVVLETMLQQMDRMNDIPEPVEFFKTLYDQPGHKTLSEISDELDREGYMRVRKLIITPTRRLLLNPELIMGNRSLRRKGAINMLRVVFREDDLHNKVSGLPEGLIRKTVRLALEKPLFVGMRRFSYLASSNSQMRDHGCYFLAGTPEEINEFRDSCGKFKVEGIPKMMSRLAQCFTQARQLGIEIERNAYSEVYDYQGGTDSNGKPYCFSDGVGIISVEFCEKIVADLRIGDCIPSCYQIRFRGYKGIVLKDSFMGVVKNWAMQHKRMHLSEELHFQKPWYAQSILFRPSQRKFRGPRIEKNVEIVKISSPIPVSLNKPLINILDQVSEMHGPDAHKRMCNRVFKLLELHLDTIVNALVDESTAFITLNEFPKFILYASLRDFHITEEPFFRSMIRSSALVGLNRLVDKMQIRIPTSQGRMMFGVVDESGLLQYGQVFFQYTVNPALKYPGRHADKIIHQGPVLITKNPSVVEGDVRMFEAVDLPCLHDLVDVLVFPQQGPRPHPDEMAGSDLDGDEYSIFFDEQLFLDRTEPAFDFTSTAPNIAPASEKEVRANFTTHMINFFQTYVSRDSIGKIANSHLANSDLYGINSEHCHNIAIKHNQAVDFPKSGHTPEDLRNKWQGDVPPETVERYPNFMCRTGSSSYKSTRLLGDLFNRVTEVQEIIRVEELVTSEENIQLDESVLIAGDAEYEAEASDAYGEYCAMIGGLLDNYGIQNEGQLFSGRFVALKKRISEKENCDTSLFNTQHMIEEQVATTYAKFRTKFFETFGGIENHTELDDRYRNGIREVFRRVCFRPNDTLRRKASAYYRVAYANKRFLSFGWLVADILASNRQQYLLKSENRHFSYSPLSERLSEHMNTFVTQTDPEFEKYQDSIGKATTSETSTSYVNRYVAKICGNFKGLEKILFFVRGWAVKHNISTIVPNSLDFLVVKFGLGDFKEANGGGWLTRNSLDEENLIDLDAQLGGIGKRFLDFIRFIMTRSFGYSHEISLMPFSKKALDSSTCLALYYAALDTFYPIAVNRRFDSLPGASRELKSMKKVTEGNLFVVEIPQSEIGNIKLFKIVARRCKCEYVVLRKKPAKIGSNNYQISVKPVGSFSAVRKFRSLLEVTPQMSEANLKRRSEIIAQEVVQRLDYYSKNDIDSPFCW